VDVKGGCVALGSSLNHKRRVARIKCIDKMQNQHLSLSLSLSLSFSVSLGSSSKSSRFGAVGRRKRLRAPFAILMGSRVAVDRFAMSGGTRSAPDDGFFFLQSKRVRR